MKASVVIPAYNATSTLPLVLAALQKQDFRDFEVVVVDDASIDDTGAMVQTLAGDLDLQLHRCSENIGWARARNYGVEKACGEIIVMLDSDIVVGSDYLSVHLSLHRRIARAVGMGILKYPDYLAKRALARYYPTRGAARINPRHPPPGNYLLSSNASLPRTLFEAVGGFNPAFRNYGGEDLELGLRLQKHGAKFEYLPNAVGIHHHLRTLKQVMINYENFGRSGVPIILHNHPEFAKELHLDDLISAKPGNLKTFTIQVLTSSVVFYPLLELAAFFEEGWLPSPLLTYLHYRAFRLGFEAYLRDTMRQKIPETH